MFKQLKHILEAILSKDYSKLVIDDSSLSRYIIGEPEGEGTENQAQKEADRPNDIRFKWNYDPKSHVFPFFYAIWDLVKNTVLYLWLGLYWCLEKVVSLFRTDKRTPDYRHSVRVNFLMTSIYAFFSAIIIVLTAAFFLRNILFFPQRSSTNTYGTITRSQPASTEFSMFLLNSAKPWSPTGITVSKGDRVYVSVSGAYYGSMSDIEKAARYNKSKKYAVKDFIHLGDESKDPNSHNQIDSINHYCVFGREKWDKHAHIGSLLLQVHPEGSIPSSKNRYHRETFWRRLFHHRDTVDIIQMPVIRAEKQYSKWPEFKKSKVFNFYASHSGTLSVMVNDVYFPKEDAEFRNRIGQLDSIQFRKLFGDEFSKGLSFRRDGSGTLTQASLDTMNTRLLKNPSVWYDDNVGEVLVNVKVERKRSQEGFAFDDLFLHAYLRAIRMFESSVFWIIVLILGVSLAIDCVVASKKRKAMD